MSAFCARPGTITALALATLLISCGGKSNPKNGDGDGSASADAGPTSPPPLRRVLHLSLEHVTIDVNAEKPTARVSLILTDETGSTNREEIGEFPGGCSNVSAAARTESMKPILGLDCWTGEAGVQLRFAHRKNKLYVVVAEVTRETTEPAYQPLKTIDLPQGTPVTTDFDE